MNSTDNKENSKNEIVNAIESLGYTIQATSQRDRKNRLYLVEDSFRVAHIDFPSNVESISKVRAKLAGELTFRDNTYLSNAVNTIYAAALAHSMANDRVAPETINSLVAKLPEHLKNEFNTRLDNFGAKAEQELKAQSEPEHFYLIRSSIKSPRDNSITSFTNEFVGTAAGLEEYRQDVQRRYSNHKPEYRPVWNEVEKFAPEFRDTHREIDKILNAYKNNTGDKGVMLQTLKSFDNQALNVLESRLKENGIAPEKFKKDFLEPSTSKQSLENNEDFKNKRNKPKI